MGAIEVAVEASGGDGKAGLYGDEGHWGGERKRSWPREGGRERER